MVKKIAKSAKTIKRASNISKTAFYIDLGFTGISSWEIYSEAKKVRKNMLFAFREAENGFCNAIDYLKYDDDLIATTARTIDTIGCSLVSPAIDLAKTSAKIPYYGVGKLIGKDQNQMDDYAERVNNAIDGVMDKFLGKLQENSFNVCCKPDANRLRSV